MDKFYTQIFYGYDCEMQVSRMVIVCDTPAEAACKAVDNLARKHYIEELEGVSVQNDDGDYFYFFPTVLVTTGGYGDEVDGEEVEREYAEYFSLEDIIRK